MAHHHSKTTYLTAVAASETGEIIDLPGYAAVGRSADTFTPLKRESSSPLPHGSELMRLPDRKPIVFHIRERRLVTLSRNPFQPSQSVCAVAVFNSPGYLVTQVSAYEEAAGAGILPLFSYGAAGWSGGGFRSAAIRVDRERRQDLRLMKQDDVTAGVRAMRKRLPGNRLRRHLEKCALVYGCPAAKNFFLGRCEAPLPTSSACNARCLGCLSHQTDAALPVSQQRIDFTPSPAEIAAVALVHIQNVNKAVVSFGQGCEGDPLLAARVIEPALRRIRQATNRGTINMNTNGSLPDVMAALFADGLDSVRISINSFREACYSRYFRPRDYCFADVKESIRRALAAGKHVALNYLNLPGFTDTPQERQSLFGFVDRYPIHLIQWRNLNYDPRQYWQAMAEAASSGPPLGMDRLLASLRRRYPHLKHAYFNPPKEKWS